MIKTEIIVERIKELFNIVATSIVFIPIDEARLLFNRDIKESLIAEINMELDTIKIVRFYNKETNGIMVISNDFAKDQGYSITKKEIKDIINTIK